MDLVSDVTKAKLSVYIPSETTGFANVVVEVKRNGIIDVSSITGPSVTQNDKLKAKATRVLRLSEDVGIMAEWLLRELRKDTASL